MNLRHRSWVFAVAAVLGSTTMGRSASAQSSADWVNASRDSGDSAHDDESNSSKIKPAAAVLTGVTAPADVVLTGATAPSTELSELIDELLRTAGVASRFLRVPEMGRTQLLAAASQPSSGHVRIWVKLCDSEHALLLFASPSRERYLVRQVTLRKGLDELGRERIGHVIQSSTLSLLRGGTGMTRAQMHRAVERAKGLPEAERLDHPRRAEAVPARASPPPQEQPTPAAQATPRRAPSERVRPRPWAVPLLGLGYAAGWSGSALNARHGPLARVGLQRIAGTALTVGMALEPDFAQEYETIEVGVRTQTTLIRMLLGAKWPVGTGLGLYSAIGGGLDVTRARPLAPPEQSVTLRGVDTHTMLLACLEAGLEIDAGSFLLELGPRVDVSTKHAHYDLVRDGILVRVATPWPVVPGLWISGAWLASSSKRGGTQRESRLTGSTPFLLDTK